MSAHQIIFYLGFIVLPIALVVWSYFGYKAVCVHKKLNGVPPIILEKDGEQFYKMGLCAGIGMIVANILLLIIHLPWIQEIRYISLTPVVVIGILWVISELGAYFFKKIEKPA